MLLESFTSAPMVSIKDDGKRAWFSRCTALYTGGHILEFGVWKGQSINMLAAEFKDKTVWGFDSFSGLPEPWQLSSQLTYPVGRFDMKGRFPSVRENVRLVVGWFKDTLPIWKNQNLGKVGILHIDSDIYSSCKYVLSELNGRIEAGTVIIFDELIDFHTKSRYEFWERGEWLALHEWLEENNREVVPVLRSDQFQAAVVVTA